MSKMIFEWKAGSRYSIGAQIAAERLMQIKDDNGSLTPRAVVDDATHDNSPLHKCFEWDNEKAADAFRLEEARRLIGSIIVAQVDDAPVSKETRAFVHTNIEGPRYEAIQVAVQQADMRAEILGRAQQEIKLWRARYAAYSEFAQLHGAIDRLLADKTAAA